MHQVEGEEGLQPGNYRWKFTYKLPDATAPSYNLEYAKTIYTAEAAVTCTSTALSLP